MRSITGGMWSGGALRRTSGRGDAGSWALRTRAPAFAVITHLRALGNAFEGVRVRFGLWTTGGGWRVRAVRRVGRFGAALARHVHAAWGASRVRKGTGSGLRHAPLRPIVR